jgi:hypothetical protein
MKWSRVFSELGKAAGIVVLVPTVLVARLRWDSVLPIIIYFQLLLIWIQAEVSLRQNELYAAQFEPLFDVQVTGASRMALTIENVSDKPAYTVSVSRFIDQSHPMPPAQWTDKVDCPRASTLVPGGKLPLCTVKDEDFAKLLRQLHMSLEVSYFDPLGRWQSLIVTFFDDDLLLTPAGRRLPGFVLNTFEALSLTWNFLWFRGRLKRERP